MAFTSDQIIQQAPHILPAIHQDWRGHLKLDLKARRITHWESGQQGGLYCTDEFVVAEWDNYQEEYFELHNNILYDRKLRLVPRILEKVFQPLAVHLPESKDLRGMPIFVMHYSPLASRREHLEQQFKNHNLNNYRLITEYDREHLSDAILDQFHFKNTIRYEEMLKALRPRFSEILHWREDSADWISNTDYNIYPTHHYQPMSLAEISLCCKHLYAIELFVRSGDEWALFLEDDAIFCDDFVSVFNQSMKEAPKDWDIAFPGLGSGAKPPGRRRGKTWYRVDPPLNRASDSYILTAQAAKLVLQHMKPFSLPSDFELLFWLNALGLRTYWWHPELITQASLDGSMASSLR